MLPMFDKKKTVSLLMAKMNPSSAPESMDENDDVGELQIVAEDILKAIEEKSSTGLAQALEDFCEMVFTKSEAEPQEEYKE